MKMQTKLLAMSLFPLIILGLTTIIFGNTRIREVVTDNIENGLRGAAVAVRDTIDYADEGELHVEDGILYKGEFDVTNATEIADHVKSATDMDITVFYGDTRYMSSVVNEQGERIIGTTAQEVVIDKVLKGNQEYFSDDVNVNGVPYFGYYIPLTEDGQVVGMVFSGMSQTEAKTEINRIISLIAGIMILFMLLFTGTTIAVVKSMAKGLIRGTGALEQVAAGKLNVELDSRFANRKDEIGQISRAVQKLKQDLTNVITEIKDNSKELLGSSEVLNEKTSASMEHISQIERAVDEIAQGAGSQAQETQSATENVISMGNMIEDTSKEITTLNENAKQIKSLGQDAVTTIEELQKINQKTRESMDMIYNQTNTTNSSAQRIKEATALITEIAEETNLLSLNASIEAARAGEQGRGFAVVAGQIQKLAEQSNESARQIEEIITSLLDDSGKAVETMEAVKEIMDEQNANVERTNDQVRQVIGQVDDSIAAIGRIAQQSEKLNETRITITDTVQNLTAVAEENAAGTQESAASVAQIGELIRDITRIAGQQKANRMDNIYQSVKGLCRAIINLLVAVVDLLAGILNGIACLFEKIRPHASGQLRELWENGGRKSGVCTEEENAGKSLKRLSAGEMKEGNRAPGRSMIQALREELQKKVVDRDTYNLAYSEASYNGQNRCQMALAAMLTLSGMIILLGVTGTANQNREALIVVLLAAGAVTCTMIYSSRRVQQKNTLIRMILEQEFAEFITVVEAEGQNAQKEEDPDTEQTQAEDSTERTEAKVKEEKLEAVTVDAKAEEQIESCAEVVKPKKNMDQDHTSKSETIN